MRGPRRYNGSQGIAGPPGPQGAQGQRGLTVQGCRNHTETKQIKPGEGFGEFRKPLQSTVCTFRVGENLGDIEKYSMSILH